MASALPTCEGVFTRTHCTHPRLFEEEYKRSNRNRGTKILRCFPHCCPHHVDRSYCGSSLEGMLRFGSDSEFVDEDSLTAVPFDVAHVFVFARFETVDGSPLSRDAYSLHYLRSVSQSELNPEGSWIEGVRQTAADTQQHSQQMHGLQTSSRPSNSRPESATFVLNGQTYAKWYYHWESGANKVQRATKHVLKAYVFYKKQVDSVQTHHQQGSELAFNQDDLELLCVVSSPPFTVVSYRRAPLEAGVALPSSLGTLGLTAGASLMPHYATDTAHPVDSRLRRLVQHQISRAFQEYNHHQHHHHGGASDEPFEPFGASNLLDEQNDDQQGSDNRDPYGRYRHLQEREGLRYRLLTPEDAALSESPLHSQIPGREPRLIFDSTRRTDDRPLWRDPSEDGDVEFVADDFNEGDTRDEAAPQPPTRPSWVAQGALNNEVKASAPIGTTPSSTDPVRHIEQTANVTLLRFKLLQHQFDNQQRELQQLTDLAIIHYFVSGVTANSAQSLANLEVVFTIAITQNWRYASGGATHLARLLLSMAKDTLGGESHAATDSLTDAKREELVLVLAEVCVWAFSPESIELVQSLLAACHPILLDSLQPDSIEDEGKELRTGILNCVRRCWSALDAFLQTPRATRTMIRSVRELSDAVLGIVYSDPKLDELRSGLRTILQRPTIVLEDSKKNAAASLDAYGPVTPRCNLAGWSGFVAQIREGYLRNQYLRRRHSWSPAQGTSAQSSRWTAEWLLQPDSLSVTHHVNPTSMRAQSNGGDNARQTGTNSSRLTVQDLPSMWTSCLALSQLLHLKLAVAGDPVNTLYVQAEPSVLSSDNAWLRLICDGRVRVAPVTPNGLTSLVGGASCGFGGDYVAYRPEQAEQNANDNSAICVEFYWWSPSSISCDTQSGLTAFRSVTTLKAAASGATLEVRMKLDRGFVAHQTVEAAEIPDMKFWIPTERVQAVTNWEPWLTIEGVYARS